MVFLCSALPPSTVGRGHQLGRRGAAEAALRPGLGAPRLGPQRDLARGSRGDLDALDLIFAQISGDYVVSIILYDHICRCL